VNSNVFGKLTPQEVKTVEEHSLPRKCFDAWNPFQHFRRQANALVRKLPGVEASETKKQNRKGKNVLLVQSSHGALQTLYRSALEGSERQPSMTQLQMRIANQEVEKEETPLQSLQRILKFPLEVGLRYCRSGSHQMRSG
jgi:hypothetical protein